MSRAALVLRNRQRTGCSSRHALYNGCWVHAAALDTALFWPVHVGSLSDEGGGPIHWLCRDFTFTFRFMEAPVVPPGLSRRTHSRFCGWNQWTADPRHGIWFALRGLGLTEIDVVEPSETRRKSIEALRARTLDPSTRRRFPKLSRTLTRRRAPAYCRGTSSVALKVIDERSQSGRVAGVLGEADKLGGYGGQFYIGVVAVDAEQGKGRLGIDAEASHENSAGPFDGGAGADGSGDGIPGDPFGFGPDC